MEKKETEKKPEGRRLSKFNKKVIIGVVTGIVAAGSIGAIVYMNATKDNKKAPASTTPVETTTVAPETVSPAELENMKKVVDDPNFYDGITINGVSVAGKSKEEVKKQFAPDASQLIDVKFKVGDDLVPLKTDGLKLESNADEIIEEAYNYGRTSTLTGDQAISDRYNTINALKSEPKNYETSFTLGDVDVDTLVHQTLDECNTELSEAVNAEETKAAARKKRKTRRFVMIAILLVLLAVAVYFAVVLISVKHSDSPVGYWVIKESSASGVVMKDEDAEAIGLSEIGSVKLNEDGKCEVVILGEDSKGTWTSDDDGNITISYDGDKTLTATINDEGIMTAQGENQMEYTLEK